MPPLSRHRRLQREKSSEVRVFLRIVIPFCTPPSLIQSQARAGRARNTDIPRASSSAGPAGPLMSSPPLHSNDSDSSSEEEEEEEEENLGSDHDLPTIEFDQERCKACGLVRIHSLRRQRSRAHPRSAHLQDPHSSRFLHWHLESHAAARGPGAEICRSKARRLQDHHLLQSNAS